MSLTDQEIASVLSACDVEPEGLVELIGMAGLEPTTSAVADVRRLAEHLGLDEEDLLYAMFAVDQPLFDDDTWTDLTEPSKEG